MRTATPFAALIVLSLMTGPALAEETARKPVPVTTFSGISVSSGLDVTFSPGPPSAVLEGNPAYFDRVSVAVRNGVLTVTRRNTLWGSWRSQVRVAVTGPAALSDLSASSGSDLTVTGVDVDTLKAEASSGADLIVSGRCGTLDADASSGADLDARGLRCDTVKANASSGADALVYVAVGGSAAASSGADVEVSGPGTLTSVTEGSGGDVTIRR